MSSTPSFVTEATDKLKAAADLLDTYGADAIPTATELALKAAEILERRGRPPASGD